MSYVFKKNGFAYKAGEAVRIEWSKNAWVHPAYCVTSRLDFRLSAFELEGVRSDKDKAKIQKQFSKPVGRFEEMRAVFDVPVLNADSTMLDFVYLVMYDLWLSDVWRGEFRNQRGRHEAGDLFAGEFVDSLDMFSVQDVAGGDLYDPVPNYENVAQIDVWRCAMLAVELMFSCGITMKGESICHGSHQSRKDRYQGFLAKGMF